MSAPDDPATVDTFRALLHEWDEALVANDAERIAALATDDWTFLGQDGPAPGTGFLDATRSGEVSHDTMSHDVHRVVDLGDVTVVLARVRNTGLYRGEPFESDEWVSEVFVRVDGSWLCLLTHLTPARAAGRS